MRLRASVHVGRRGLSGACSGSRGRRFGPWGVRGQDRSEAHRASKRLCARRRIPVDEPPVVTPPLLRVRGLVKHFPVRGGLFRRQVRAVRAVDGVDFHIEAGETLGLVGESGSGKSTTGRAVLQLIRPDAGSVEFDGTELTHLQGAELRSYRRHLGVVFQDPFASLNPRRTVGQAVREPMDVHRQGTPAERERRQAFLMEAVGLPAGAADRYPHELSGGQRQRIGIARALSTSPKLLVLDEPISALDVSIQAQILNLLERLRDELSLTYLFIAHDLAVVRHICARVAVMYLGRIVESGPAAEVFERPMHPYTRALLAAAPTLSTTGAQGRRASVQGEVPDPAHPPTGCAFHPRCPRRTDLCVAEAPTKKPVQRSEPVQGSDLAGTALHSVACHHADERD